MISVSSGSVGDLRLSKYSTLFDPVIVNKLSITIFVGSTRSS